MAFNKSRACRIIRALCEGEFPNKLEKYALRAVSDFYFNSEKNKKEPSDKNLVRFLEEEFELMRRRDSLGFSFLRKSDVAGLIKYERGINLLLRDWNFRVRISHFVREYLIPFSKKQGLYGSLKHG